MSRSSRRTLFSRRNRRSSSRSSVVRPSRSPASTAAWPTQWRTAVSLRSSSRLIVGNDRSPRRTKAITSALNSGVNDRRFRRRAPFPSTCFPMRTPPRGLTPTSEVSARSGQVQVVVLGDEHLQVRQRQPILVGHAVPLQQFLEPAVLLADGVLLCRFPRGLADDLPI